MFANRIEKYASLLENAAFPMPVATAFVACPMPLFAHFSQAQQLVVAEIYRRAREMTDKQLRKPSRSAIPVASLN